MKKKEKNISESRKKRIPFLHFEQLHMADICLILYDLAAVVVAYFFALWFRFDCNYTEIPREYLMAWLNFSPFYLVISLVVFRYFRLYQSVWRFASFVELRKIMLATGILGVIHTVAITLFFRRMPISYYVIGIGFQFFLVVAVRFSYRFVLLERSKRDSASREAVVSRVMLVGGGIAGQLILRDLHGGAEIKERVYCIIDDDIGKHGRYIDGVPIVGGREDILLNVEKYKIEKIYLTMPGATAEQRRDILDICKETGCQLKNLPGISGYGGRLCFREFYARGCRGGPARTRARPCQHG